MKKASENWFKIASKDLKLAKMALKGKESMGVVFHLHAAIEKLLKAIAEERGTSAPKTHSLTKLAVDTCQIKLQDYQRELIASLDKAFIDSRYPEDIDEFEKEYNYQICKSLYKSVEVNFKWLKDLLIKN